MLAFPLTARHQRMKRKAEIAGRMMNSYIGGTFRLLSRQSRGFLLYAHYALPRRRSSAETVVRHHALTRRSAVIISPMRRIFDAMTFSSFDDAMPYRQLELAMHDGQRRARPPRLMPTFRHANSEEAMLFTRHAA